MITALRRRLDAKSEQGFTLIELLVVIIIIGILLAIAVPSYLGFRDRAANSAAQANLRAAIPSIEAFAADNVTTGANDSNTAAGTTGYEGMTPALLLAIDAGLSPTLRVFAGPTTTYYCAEAGGDGGTDEYYYQVGNAAVGAVNAVITAGSCA